VRYLSFKRKKEKRAWVSFEMGYGAGALSR
jgi:hypothetical protein